MKSEGQRDRSFERLRALTQALAHRFRTPLSVISNDLTYFKSSFKSEEFDRGIRRCRELSELLSYICGFFVERDDTYKIDLGSELKSLIGPANARLSANHFRVALANMFEVLFESSVIEEAAIDRVVLVGQLKASVVDSEHGGVYEGFTELFFERLGQDIIDAPLFDSLIAADEIAAKISLQPHSIKIELCRQAVRSSG